MKYFFVFLTKVRSFLKVSSFDVIPEMLLFGEFSVANGTIHLLWIQILHDYLFCFSHTRHNH